MTGAAYGPPGSIGAGVPWTNPVAVQIADRFGNVPAVGTGVTLAVSTSGVPLYMNGVSNSVTVHGHDRCVGPGQLLRPVR